MAVRKRIRKKRVGRSAVAGRKPAVDKKKARAKVGVKHEWRSGLERSFGNFLQTEGIDFEFEASRLEFVVPEYQRHYTPDFEIGGIYFETKGRFTSEDRKKMLLVLASNPGIDLWMVFGRPQNTITKRSKTTYGDWCAAHGIAWIGIDELTALIKKNKGNYADLLQRRKKRLGLRPDNGKGSPRATRGRKEVRNAASRVCNDQEV